LNKKSFSALSALFFIACMVMGGVQQNPPPSKTGATRIYEEYADSMIMQKEINPDVHIFRGNVRFRHDSTYLHCDSAYLYMTNNSLEAFSNVKIEQGDTLFIYGDYLIYEGNTSIAKMRENVRMENNNLTLFTDNFDFDRIKNIGYFFDGGMLIDSINELTSIYGKYSPSSKIATFNQNVVLTNPQFVLHSDTLIYNTVNKVTNIVGPTIIESDSGTIYSNKGWYNTITDESTLLERSIVVSDDKTKTMTADTLFFNRHTGFGEAYGHMILNDTAKKIILMGDYGYYDGQTKFAFATDSAQMIEYSMPDSLFLHADTLQMQTIGRERELKAFYGVRFFRNDLQGVCDSLQFQTRDSVLNLYKNPVLWNTEYQLTGDTIRTFFNDSTIEKVDVLNYAFSMQQIDTAYYNQLKGRNLYAFFTAGELNRIEVHGNAESIYYPLDDDSLSFIGQNSTESSFMIVTVNNRKPVEIWWYPQPKMKMLPIPDLAPEKKYLKDFVNYNYIRPKNKDDIFTKTVRKAEDIPPPRRQRRTRQ
jgi:lipopolysaccharide export system protein LptA